MLLEDAESKEQVAAALEADDEELANDIEEKLDTARSWWSHHGMHHVGEDEEALTLSDFDGNPEFVAAVIKGSPTEYNLAILPVEVVEAELRWTARRMSQTNRANRRLWGPFYIDTEGGDFFSFRVTRSLSAYFPDHHLPFACEYIPQDLAEEFWSSLEGGVEWDQTHEVKENSGHLDTHDVFVEAKEEGFVEWCRDLLNEQVSKLADSQPQVVKDAFFSQLPHSVGKELAAAQIPDADLLSLAASWIGGDEGIREETLETIQEYLAAFTEGASEEREVIGEWSRDDLRAMDITKGPLFEEAPWKLIKLHPADLRLEGTLMRHCVGDKGMGYIKALKDGDIEIWSLRSRNNKPRFTLEVNGDFDEDGWKMWVHAPGPVAVPERNRWRALSIKQLKGKANRTPGYADKYANEITFPDEVIFWAHALDELDVYADLVDDFRAYDAPLRRNDGESCSGFDLPYRPLRRR